MSVKVLRLALWPESDQAAWAAALEEGDIFDGRGPAAHWSAGSRRSIASGYGRWIGHLTAEEPEALSLAPADRVTRDRLRPIGGSRETPKRPVTWHWGKKQ